MKHVFLLPFMAIAAISLLSCGTTSDKKVQHASYKTIPKECSMSMGYKFRIDEFKVKGANIHLGT